MSVDKPENSDEPNIIIREGKFSRSELTGCAFLSVAELPDIAAIGSLFVDLASDESAEDLVPYFNAITLIRVAFPTIADGRGFSLAQRLRALGYRGTLRAYGALISDQYPMALRTGFDELEISAELAQRQPEQQWRDRLPKSDTYRKRLGLVG